MQVLISSARPAAALATRSGSARNGRAIDTRSQRAVGDQLLGQLGGVDPVRGDDRHTDRVAQPGGPRRPEPAGDLGDDRGDARLVPADAGVERGHAGDLEPLRQLDGLVPGLAALDQVEQGDPVDDGEVVADDLADPLDDPLREAHPGRRVAAPLVGAVVGARREELVDQVALGPHHLDGVVPGLAGERDRPREVVDGAVDRLRRQCPGREGRDRRLHRGRADAERVVGVAARVEHLQRDRAAGLVDRVGDLPVTHRVEPGRHLAGERLEPGPLVDGVAAGDHQPDAAACPLGEVRRELRHVPRLVLEPGVHRPHDHPVGQLEGAEPDRLQQVWVAHVASR